MRLKEFLDEQTQERRILIVSDTARAGQLFRRYEAAHRRIIRNVNPVTLKGIAEQFFHHVQAEHGPVPEYRLLSSTEAMMVFRSVLLKNTDRLQYFTDERMFNLRTSAEIYRKADLIRVNGITEEAERRPNFHDLILLNKVYEQELEQRRMLDDTALYQYVLERTNDHSKELFGKSYGILQEDTDRLSGIQKKLLEKCFGTELITVSAFDEDTAEIKDASPFRNVQFFKGYGSYNEAAFIADDIAKHSDPLGRVLILYSSDAQVRPLQAALNANGLAAKYLSPYTIQNNPYMTLMRSMLEWSRTDYSEQALKKILGNDALLINGKKEDGEEINLVGDSHYFDYVIIPGSRFSETDRVMLGWGYAHNAAFIRHESLQQYRQSPELLKFHRELLEAFGDGEKAYDSIRPACIYRSILSLLVKYTRPAPEKEALLEGLWETERAVVLEERDLPLSEGIDFLQELLEQLRMKDRENMSAISVRRISDWTVPDRPYVYMTGLALKDMQGADSESPVIRDEELVQYTGDGWKPTLQAQAELKERNLFRTLKLYSGEKISFGYSFYDTINVRESGPSSFYRRIYSLFGEPKEQVFAYGNPSEGLVVHAEPESKAQAIILEKSSASSMGQLLNCPKQYYYVNIRKLPDHESPEPDDGRWLQASDLGSFFHAAAERYTKKKLIRPAGESIEEKADEALLSALFEELKEAYRLTVPAFSEGLTDQESDELLEDTVRYFNEVHTDLVHSGWHALFAELRFRKAHLAVKTDEDTIVPFVYSGTIDRIDYRVDNDTKAVFLRIVDYKTGREENKENEEKQGILLQHAMYYHALMENEALTEDSTQILDYVKKAVKEKENRDLDDYRWLFDTFRYEFPRDGGKVFSISRKEMEGLNLYRLIIILKMIQQYRYYPNIFEMYDLLDNVQDTDDPHWKDLEKILEKKVKELQRSDSAPCTYCTYADLCGRKGVDG